MNSCLSCGSPMPDSYRGLKCHSCQLKKSNERSAREIAEATREQTAAIELQNMLRAAEIADNKRRHEEIQAQLKVNVSQAEIDKIIKEYKRIKKGERSNLTHIKKLGLVDKHGRPLK